MSLISLLIALAAERYLSASAWQFNTYFAKYVALFNRISPLGKANASFIANIALVAIPVAICYFILTAVSDGLLHLIISTLVLIVCFGCVKTRDCYKQFLMAAFRGEPTTCDLHHQTLMQDKNLKDMGFGQMLVWLNYRYFIAVMIFFVVFGAPGALFYRLLTKINETPCQEVAESESIVRNNQLVLFWVDFVPVRIVAFGYMLVGHFSRALPVWLEGVFDFSRVPNRILLSVAQKSEDFMVDADDCTAEPCLLVRLAKRTLLLFLALNAILIITGTIS